MEVFRLCQTQYKGEAMMKSNKIEMNALLKLRTSLERCDRVGTDIRENDRTPSWDGDIYIYSSANNEKANIIGKISIQVKGKEVSNFNNPEITYPVDCTDIRNFRHVGGTIFFVIYMTDYDHYKIYYNALLPLDLEELSKSITHNQKTKNIVFKEFPDTDTEIMYIFDNFIIDSRKQHSTAKTGYIKIGDDTKFDSITLSATFSGTSLSCLFSYPLYIYGKNEELNIEIPLNRVMIESIQKSEKLNIKVNDDDFLMNVTRKFGGTTRKIYIGNGFELDINNGKFTFSPKGTVSEQIQDHHFFIALVKNNFMFEMNGIKIKNKKENQINIDEIEVQLKLLLEIEEFMARLNIKASLDLENLSEAELAQFKTIKDAIIKGETISIQGDDAPTLFVRHKIANWYLLVIAKKVAPETYKIFNFFDEQNDLCKMKTENREVECSIYTLLKKVDFLEVSNIDYNQMHSAMVSVPFSSEYGQVLNLLILEMLSAYDENNAAELIECCRDVAYWLSTQDKDEIFYRMNYFQALKRLRPLLENEMAELISMKEDVSKKDNCYRHKALAGIGILTESESEFIYYFKRLTLEDQQEFVKFPIFELAKRMWNGMISFVGQTENF